MTRKCGLLLDILNSLPKYLMAENLRLGRVPAARDCFDRIFGEVESNGKLIDNLSFVANNGPEFEVCLEGPR